MMTLEQYLAEEKQTQREFARAMDMSPSYINEIVKGVKCPSLSLALKIVKATGDKVSIAALLRPADSDALANQVVDTDPAKTEEDAA